VVGANSNHGIFNERCISASCAVLIAAAGACPKHGIRAVVGACPKHGILAVVGDCPKHGIRAVVGACPKHGILAVVWGLLLQLCVYDLDILI
jgi:hypothetical protein